jgi:hypothetical protein
MTKLLQQAFDEASRLPDSDQDALAALLLSEIESDRRWDEAFVGSEDLLGRLAEEALAEHRAGLTQDLDPDQL